MGSAPTKKKRKVPKTLSWRLRVAPLPSIVISLAIGGSALFRTSPALGRSLEEGVGAALGELGRVGAGICVCFENGVLGNVELLSLEHGTLVGLEAVAGSSASAAASPDAAASRCAKSFMSDKYTRTRRALSRDVLGR